MRPQGDRTDVVVALAQLAPRLGDVAANLDRHLELVDEAAAGGAALIVFPELSLTGYFLKDLVPEVALREQSETVDRLAAASRRRSTWSRAASSRATTPASTTPRCTSPAAASTTSTARCTCPPTGSSTRRGTWPRATASAPSPRPWRPPRRRGRGRRGCWSARTCGTPPPPALLAREGVELFICPSASPGRGVVHGHALGTARSYDAMTRTYAQLFTAYLLYCNRVGFEDGIGFWGGSRAVGPDGRLLDDPAGSDECLVLHRIDLAAVRRARIANPLLRDERHDINDSETDRLRHRRALD